MLSKKEYQREYRIKNKEEIAIRRAKWRKSHKELISTSSATYHKKNKPKLNKKSRLDREKYLSEWVEHITILKNCEICGKEIHLASGNQRNSIHFDHKVPSRIIGTKPTGWLASNKWSEEKEEIWNNCDFGFLCYKCNKYLPTESRKEFIKMSFKYVFGKEFPMEL